MPRRPARARRGDALLGGVRVDSTSGSKHENRGSALTGKRTDGGVEWDPDLINRHNRHVLILWDLQQEGHDSRAQNAAVIFHGCPRTDTVGA